MVAKFSASALRSPFIPAVCFLVVAFALGGASRADTASLIILRPLAVAFASWALSGLTMSAIRPLRVLYALAASALLIAVIQLIPLPFDVWRALPGHAPIAHAAATGGLTNGWQPISLVPSGTRNALFSMLIPIAVLTLATRLSTEERFDLSGVLLLFGFASALFGLLQACDPTNDMLYFYQVTNRGMPVGLMANRDHQATLLAVELPLLALYAAPRPSDKEEAPSLPRRLTAFVGAAILVPLILITGSRAGVLLAAVGLASVPLLNTRQPGSRNKLTKLYWTLAILTFCALILLTIFASRAQAIERLIGQDQSTDFRFRAWPTVGWGVMKYFPTGSGLGSFDKVFQLDEPDSLLKPTYLNHAHNDWLELVLTGGAGAALLLLIALLIFVRCSVVIFRQPALYRSDRFGRAGIIVIGMLGAASIVDYPLRTPALIALFTVAAIWTATSVDCMRSREREGEAQISGVSGKSVIPN